MSSYPGVPGAFQVVTDLMGLDLLLVEDDAQRALSKLAQATVPLARPMFAQPRAAVRIAALLGLAAGQIHHPGLGLGRDGRLPARARQIIKRGHRAKGEGSLAAALTGLLVPPDAPGHRKKMTRPPGRRAAFALARPGSLVPPATASPQSTWSPPPSAPTRSPAAPPP